MNGHNFKVGERCTVRFVGCEFGEKDYNGVVIRVDAPRDVVEIVMPGIGLKCEFGRGEGENEWHTPFDTPDKAIIKPVGDGGSVSAVQAAEA